MKLRKPAIASLIVWLSFLFIASIFKTNYIRYQQIWMEGVAQLLVGFCFFTPGIFLMIIPNFTIDLFQAIATLFGNRRIQVWNELNHSTKLKIFGIAFVNLLIGVLLLGNGLLILL